MKLHSEGEAALKVSLEGSAPAAWCHSSSIDDNTLHADRQRATDHYAMIQLVRGKYSAELGVVERGRFATAYSSTLVAIIGNGL